MYPFFPLCVTIIHHAKNLILFGTSDILSVRDVLMAKLVFSDRHGCLAENGYWLMTNFIAKCERNAIPDEQIDTSDIPELTEEDFARGHSKYRIHPLELTFLAAMI